MEKIELFYHLRECLGPHYLQPIVFDMERVLRIRSRPTFKYVSGFYWMPAKVRTFTDEN